MTTAIEDSAFPVPERVDLVHVDEGDLDEIDFYDDDDDDVCEEDPEHEPQHHHANERRRVRFAPDLVESVWERPRTLAYEKEELFYSGAEIHEFRLAFRELRRQRVLAANRSKKTSSVVSFLSGIVTRASHLASNTITKGLATHPVDEKGPDNVLLVDTLYLF